MINKVQSRQKTTSYSGKKHLDLALGKDRQKIFSIARELVHAQFELADQELTNRLWQSVVDNDFDIERILNLMYRCSLHDDDIAMLETDLLYEDLFKN